MKKLFVLLMTAMLLVSCACAGSLDDLLPASSGLLPDPCLAVRNQYRFVGQMYRENFTLGTDYHCAAYLYPEVDDSFVSSYAKLAKQYGYTMTETKVDGRDGYSIQNGTGLKALMVPEFQNHMLFLVEKGMDFVLTNVCSFTYNDATYQMALYQYDTPKAYPHDRWKMRYRGENSAFEQLSVSVPKEVRTGNKFTVKGGEDAYDGLTLAYTETSSYNNRLLLEDYAVLYRTDCIDGPRDYAKFNITRVEDTPTGKLIVGTFEGCFSNEGEVFEDCCFSALIPQ